METVYFPGLNFGVELHPIAFSIGSIDVYWYGIIIALGFLLALIYGFSRLKEFGLNSDRFIDVVLGGAVGGIVGGRLYYVLASWELYQDDLLSIFMPWKGGMAIYGAIIGALLVGFLMCKWRKMPVLPVFDLAATGFLIGQAVGRWGNFVNVEAFGTNTDLPWGMTSTSISRYLSAHAEDLQKLGVSVVNTDPVHPCFLYESLWCLVGFILLALYTKHRRFDGEVFLLYVAWYGIGRSFIEGLRTDSLLIGTLRISQVLAVVSAIAAIVLMIVVRSKIRRHNDPDYLPLYVDTDASKNFVHNLELEKQQKKERKANRKSDLVRAEELYQRKRVEKAEETRARREAMKAEREQDWEAEAEQEIVEDEALEQEQTARQEQATEESTAQTGSDTDQARTEPDPTLDEPASADDEEKKDADQQ